MYKCNKNGERTPERNFLFVGMGMILIATADGVLMLVQDGFSGLPLSGGFWCSSSWSCSSFLLKNYFK
jgi:hypothetical protein